MVPAWGDDHGREIRRGVKPRYRHNVATSMRENSLANWELRVGEYRVFYRVVSDQVLIMIVAVGVKAPDVLRIEGKETHL
jgi:mRNA-degrading endonuclease RelE of RelBE toxin-antitoxin system